MFINEFPAILTTIAMEMDGKLFTEDFFIVILREKRGAKTTGFLWENTHWKKTRESGRMIEAQWK